MYVEYLALEAYDVIAADSAWCRAVRAGAATGAARRNQEGEARGTAVCGVRRGIPDDLRGAEQQVLKRHFEEVDLQAPSAAGVRSLQTRRDHVARDRGVQGPQARHGALPEIDQQPPHHPAKGSVGCGRLGIALPRAQGE